MSHLTDEQLEDLMHCPDSQPEHLASCDQCRGRLAEKEVLAVRLRSAFATVMPEESLAKRISQQLSISSPPFEEARTRTLLDIRSHWRGWLTIVSAAAAVVIIAIPLVAYLATPSPAIAAQALLVQIHEHNMSPNHEFYSDSDPEKLAEYFTSKLGFSPALPRSGQGLALRGCCVRHFRGQIVGSYVVETPEGVISVIVVTDPPKSLGMARNYQHGRNVFWKSSFAKCDMVSAQLGQYTYCAVGEVPHQYLAELLACLLDD